jgi:hypothetical protein
VADDLYAAPLTEYFDLRELHWAEIHAAGLGHQLTGLLVTRTRPPGDDTWDTPVVGFVALPVEQLTKIIRDKEADIVRWPKVSERWLLVVLRHESLAEITQPVRDLVLASSFQRVDVFEEVHGEIVRISNSK